MKQNILSKKPIFKAKFFTVNELEIEIKPGVKRVHHNVERVPIVYIFPLTENDEIYLASQYRYNVGKEVLDAIAGHIEEGEEPLAAAKRELVEETGLNAGKWTQLSSAELGVGTVLTKVHMYVAQNLILGETNFDEGEDISLVKLPFSEALEKVVKGEINVVSGMTGLLLIDKLKQLGGL